MVKPLAATKACSKAVPEFCSNRNSKINQPFKKINSIYCHGPEEASQPALRTRSAQLQWPSQNEPIESTTPCLSNSKKDLKKSIQKSKNETH
jgi:hypothetical protein